MSLPSFKKDSLIPFLSMTSYYTKDSPYKVSAQSVKKWLSYEKFKGVNMSILSYYVLGLWSTGLFYTKDSPKKNFSPIDKELTELSTFWSFCGGRWWSVAVGGLVVNSFAILSHLWNRIQTFRGSDNIHKTSIKNKRFQRQILNI